MLEVQLARLAKVLKYAYHCPNEAALQNAIEYRLRAAGIPYEREVRLDGKSRIDFKVGGIGIEIKVGGSKSSVIRQLHRYSKHLDAIILVTTKMRHREIPETMRVPIRVVYLNPLL